MMSVAKAEKERFWRGEMARYADFSGSQGAFCRERGLSPFQFKYWARRLGKLKLEKAVVASPFIPITVSEPNLSQCTLPDPRWLAEFIVGLHRAAR